MPNTVINKWIPNLAEKLSGRMLPSYSDQSRAQWMSWSACAHLLSIVSPAALQFFQLLCLFHMTLSL